MLNRALILFFLGRSEEALKASGARH